MIFQVLVVFLITRQMESHAFAVIVVSNLHNFRTSDTSGKIAGSRHIRKRDSPDIIPDIFVFIFITVNKGSFIYDQLSHQMFKTKSNGNAMFGIR